MYPLAPDALTLYVFSFNTLTTPSGLCDNCSTMRVGFLLSSSPESEDGYTVGQLAGKLRLAGHDVSLFLMDDGVYHAATFADTDDGTGYSKLEIIRLMDAGVRVALCAVTAKARGLGKEQLTAGVELSSQYELSQMVKDADRFLVFGEA